MTEKDWTPKSQPIEEADPLSATGMFLNALGKESQQPQTRLEMDPPQPPVRQEITPPAWQAETPVRTAVDFEPPKAAPGEFTRLFQAATSPAAPPPRAPAVPAPAPSFEPRPSPSPASAPGEFNRIFVNPSDAKPVDRVPAPPPTKAIPDAPATHQAASPARMKGFSSGASDSASAEGGFTQFFQARPAAPAPTPASAPHVQTYSPPPPSPVPSPAPPREEFKPMREADFSASPSAGDSGANSSSVTNLFASLAPAKPRQQEVKAPSYEPLPSYTPAPPPPPEPSGGEAGSVTRLIQRLSATPAAGPTPAPTPIAAPPANSGPGEFTRMINAGAMRTASSAPAAPPAAAAPMPMPAFAPPAMPAAPAMPAMPAAPKPAAPPAPAFQAPKFEPPKPAAPAFAPPALAAPKSKLEEMVPILLVVNTFLLIVLIVLVAFALKAK